MYRILKKLTSDTRGTSAVEYGIICALIVIAIISAAQGVADVTTGMWGDVSSKSAEAICST